MFQLRRTAQDPRSAARAGIISTDHGEIHTPIFMPVGTVGSVKGVYHRDLRDDIRAEIILGNTYTSICAPAWRPSARPAACTRSRPGTARS